MNIVVIAIFFVGFVAIFFGVGKVGRFVRSLLQLLELLVVVKRRCRYVRTDHPTWNMAETIEESFGRHGDHDFVIVVKDDDHHGANEVSTTESTVSGSHSSLTYRDAERASSAVALWMTSSWPSNEESMHDTYGPGDIVAVFMPGGYEFVVATLGLIRCGIKAAFLSTELKGSSLIHAVTDALDQQVRVILCSSHLKRTVLDPLMESGQIPSTMRIVEFCDRNDWTYGSCSSSSTSSSKESHVHFLNPWKETRSFAWMGFHKGRQLQRHGQQERIKTQHDNSKNQERHQSPNIHWDDVAVYIYTSGTTGLPKASKINHMRMWSAGCITNKVCRLRKSDRLYCPLPLHHASGYTLGLIACLQRGCTIVIRPKFSVSSFSSDLVKYNCTAMQYIGEMARYLVSAKPYHLDGRQPLRFAYGNGMPADVWVPFQKRYRIGQVNEFYASTEGNVNIFNNTGLAPGACGIVPRGLEWIYPIGLFRYDNETGDLLRDKTTGLCVPAARGEQGELLGLIQQNDPSRRYDGYADSKATESKVVRNVCKPGDTYFRSGDLLRQDLLGFLYFCDRIGDTFRWKGENVSTSEVARVMLQCKIVKSNDNDGSNKQAAEGEKETKISSLKSTSSSFAGMYSLPVFSEVVVYGVEVPGYPGRAGMAAAVMDDQYLSDGRLRDGSWTTVLWQHLRAELPTYAQPIFVRITSFIEKTSTEKYKKNKLQEESFIECGNNDSIYFRDDQKKSFVPMDTSLRRDILSNKRRI